MSETAPDLVGQRKQKVGLKIKRAHRQQHHGAKRDDQRTNQVGRHVFQAIEGLACACERSIASSFTGKLTKAAKTPSAMAMYHTMS
jgi:hypothetical protein